MEDSKTWNDGAKTHTSTNDSIKTNTSTEATPLLSRRDTTKFTINTNDNSSNKFVSLAFRLDKCSKVCVIPISIGTTIIASLALVFLAITLFNASDFMFILICNISFYSVFYLQLMVSIICMYMTYKYGTISMHIKQLKSQTNEFSNSMTSLKQETNTLKDNVNAIRNTISGLHRNCQNLEDQLLEFDELNDELQNIAKDQEDMLQLVDNLNNITKDMQDLAIKNLEARLYHIYYDVEFKDENAGMDKREYTRFLNALDMKTRALFNNFTKIDINHDRNISIFEFKMLIEKVLTKITQDDFERYLE